MTHRPEKVLLDSTERLVHVCRKANQFISRAFRNDLLSPVTIGAEAKALADEIESDTMPGAKEITEVQNSLLYALAMFTNWDSVYKETSQELREHAKNR